MNKILAVARAEYFIATTSKAFVLGIFLMPVFMGGAVVVQYLTKDQVDTTPRKVAIADHTGRMFQALEQQANHYNEQEIFFAGAGCRGKADCGKVCA
jgi:ABC-type Na+ efflux pump permease subunit